MNQDYSRASLLAFLREESVGGRLHPATARSWRKATEALSAYLEEPEQNDLRTLSLPDLVQRIHDAKDRELRDELVELYAQRLQAALEAFLGGATARSQRSESGATVPRGNPVGPESVAEASALEAVSLAFDHQRGDVVPIPLEGGRVVFLHGLPGDLSARDARRISRIVEAYISDDGYAQ